MPTFGDTTSGTDTFPMQDGRAIVTLQTCPESATVTSIWAYFDTTTTAGANAKGIVLANSSGTPGAVLIVSSSTAIPAGGGWVQMTASGSLSATTYFIGVVTNDGGGHSALNEDATPTTFDTEMANGTFDFVTPPGTWPGTDASYSVQINVYVEYTAAGGGGPLVRKVFGSPIFESRIMQ